MDTLRYIVNHIWVPIELKPDPVARHDMDELYGGGQYDETSF